MDDLDRIMEVMIAAFEPEYGESWTRNQVESALLAGNCQTILIGVDGGQPKDCEPAAGFILSRRLITEEELLLFAVAPAFRRRGLGAKMLDQLLTKCRASGMSHVFLEMRRGNPAETLYRSRGFAPVGERPNYYRTSSGARMDGITFQHRL